MIAVVGATGNTGRAVVKELMQSSVTHQFVSYATRTRRVRFWERTPRLPLPN